MAQTIKTPMTRCRGCKKAVESWSSAEVWHEECYRQHRADNTKCEAHRACAREMAAKREATAIEREKLP